MDFFEFDNVRAEKEDAMRRYNRRRLLKCLLLLCQVCAAFFSLSWFSTWLPDAVLNAGGFCRGLLLAFDRPLFVFLLLNLLIVVLFVLSSRKNNTPSDLYDEYIATSRSTAPAADDSPPAKEELPEEAFMDKQVIHVENVVSVSKTAVSPAKQDAESEVREAKSAAYAVPRGGGTVNVVKRKKYVKRTQSETSHTFDDRNNRRELRRSETMFCREVVVARKSMEDLSNEEFRLTVESFIAEKKKALMKENISLVTRERTKHMAIVLSK